MLPQERSIVVKNYRLHTVDIQVRHCSLVVGFTHVATAILQSNTVDDELELAILRRDVVLVSMEHLQLVLQPAHLGIGLGILAPGLTHRT